MNSNQLLLILIVNNILFAAFIFFSFREKKEGQQVSALLITLSFIEKSQLISA